MRIIVYVDEKGTEDGNCRFREIDICEEDKQSLLVLLGHSLGKNNVFEDVSVLTEDEYRELLKFRDTHPDYIKYSESKAIVRKFEDKYGIHQ